jgi:hypothetical protein
VGQLNEKPVKLTQQNEDLQGQNNRLKKTFHAIKRNYRDFQQTTQESQDPFSNSIRWRSMQPRCSDFYGNSTSPGDVPVETVEAGQ